MPFLRQSYKQKPKQWGPFSAVQSALFHNAERMWIDPASIALAMPMWNPGDQRDYSKHGLIGVNTSAIYKNNSLLFDGNDKIAFNSPINIGDLDAFTCVGVVETTSTLRGDIYSEGYSGGNSPLVRLTINEDTTGADTVGFQVTGSSAGKIISSDVNVSDGSQHSIIGVQTTKSNRELFFDGLSVGTNSTSVGGLSNLNRQTIGVLVRASTALYYNGSIKSFINFSINLNQSQIAELSDNPYQLWQPVPQKTIFLPLESGSLPINVTGSCSFSGEVTRKVLYNRSVEGEI